MDFPSLTNYYYIKDHLGSTRMVVDESGEAIEANMYDSYGKLSQLVYSGTSTRLREKFTGKELDDEGAVEGETNGLGLYYFGVRYYDPEIGTFTTTDPKDVYHNSYSYCGGDPINNIDPVGADAATIAGAFLLVGLAAVAWFWQNTAEYETPNPLDWDWGDPELISSTAVLAMNLAGTIISEVQMAKAAAAANKQGLRLEDYRGHLMKRASSKSDLVNLVDNSGEANDYGAVTGGGMESTEPSNMVTGSGEAMFKAPSSVTELIQDFLAWREANFQWFVANFGEPTPIYTIGNQNYYAADMLPLGGGIKIIQGVKIAELLKGTGQIPALLRNPNLKGVNVQELLTKTIDEAKQLLNKQQFKTLLKHFEGRDLRHGK